MSKQTYTDISVNELIQLALARQEGELAANGALVVNTGARTGRSPKDRFIVRDNSTETTVNWNQINQAISPDQFKKLWDTAADYLEAQPTKFVSHLQVGAHSTYGLAVTVMTELAWHNLFAKVLFMAREAREFDAAHQWTILSTPGCATAGSEDGVNSDAAVILNFTERKILIRGTYYAGEMKKAMFSVLNYLLPAHAILPMHCAANMGKDGQTALFFGLSGTGKTTLSADPERFLIGDDEHGWGQDIVFNFEGGCYAKCIDLSQEREPLIWDAIRHGSVIENVVIDPTTKIPDYADASLTQNTRAAYPREFIQERVLTNRGPEPSAILFLTCDLFGVLPPVAKLTKEQAAYYFLSGYTALVGSTEVGQGSGIKPTFSTCFGAPFFPRAPRVYAELLMQRLQEHDAQVYLVNTGWTGGAHGKGGQRFSIPTTRQIVSAIVSGELKSAAYETIPGFNLQIPTAIAGVDAKLLNPIKTWANEKDYFASRDELMQLFNANFKQFDVSDEIRNAGPGGEK